MTRTEKIAAALDEIGQDSRNDAILKAHILSLLDGCVIVPREATEGMLKAGTTHALNTSISSQTGGWPAYISGQWSAMISASEEGE